MSQRFAHAWILLILVATALRAESLWYTRTIDKDVQTRLIDTAVIPEKQLLAKGWARTTAPVPPAAQPPTKRQLIEIAIQAQIRLLAIQALALDPKDTDVVAVTSEAASAVATAAAEVGK